MITEKIDLYLGESMSFKATQTQIKELLSVASQGKRARAFTPSEHKKIVVVANLFKEGDAKAAFDAFDSLDTAVREAITDRVDWLDAALVKYYYS